MLGSIRSSSARRWLIVLVAITLAGCGRNPQTGGGTDSATPAGGLGGVPQQNNVAAVPPPVEHAAANKKPTPAAVEKIPPSQDPTINPHDVFEVARLQPAVEKVEQEGRPVSADRYAAIFPPRGVDTTKFQLAVPPTEPTNSSASPAPFRSDETASPAESPRETPKRFSGSPSNSSTTRRRGTTAAKSTSKPASGRRPGKANPNSRTKSSDDLAHDGEKKLPAGFSDISRGGQKHLGWPVRIRCDRDGAEMAIVKGGAVTVGHDGGPPESSPQITVVLDSFYMDVNEVTLGQYQRFREALKAENGRNVIPAPADGSSPPNFPALGMTLVQAQFYAHWAGKELPTESEWERAARGELAFNHPWGNGRAIWREARGPDDISPVKSFRTDVSPFGIYDMAGNAREWCVDRYSPTAFADALKSSSGPLRNWKGAPKAQPADFHVVKGNGPNWEAWYRVGMNATQRHANIGFRCVLRLPEKTE